MKIKNALYFFSIIGCMALFSPEGHSMEEEIKIDPSYKVSSHRVQIASYVATQGKEDGHKEFNRLAGIASHMKDFPAYLVQEKESSWIRLHLQCENEPAAQQLVGKLEPLLRNGTHAVKPGTVTMGQNLPLQFAIRHIWEE